MFAALVDELCAGLVESDGNVGDKLVVVGGLVFAGAGLVVPVRAEHGHNLRC